MDISISGLLWLGNMRIQIQLCADLIPVGEALVLHARHVANQIGTLLGHVIAQRIRNILGQIMQLRQHRKCDHIQSGWLVAKEEWLAVQHLAEYLQIILAELLDLLGAVHADAVRLELFRTLEPLVVFNMDKPHKDCQQPQIVDEIFFVFCFFFFSLGGKQNAEYAR